MERSTIFNGKIHYFYGHFQSQTVSLPEGKSPMFCWLVVWNMAFMTSPIVGMMIQSDELIFFRGVETTNQFCWLSGSSFIMVGQIPHDSSLEQV